MEPKVSDETKEQKAIKDTANGKAERSPNPVSLDSSKSKTQQTNAYIRQKIAKVEAITLAHKSFFGFPELNPNLASVQTHKFTNKALLSQRQIAMQLSNQFGTMFSIYAVERFVKKL